MTAEETLSAAITNGTLELPVLPAIANQVLVLSQDSDADSATLAKLIQSDMAMAGHVMRVANSVAYSPNGNIVSLQQAITRLGMNSICNIAVGISVNGKLFNAPGYEPVVEKIWCHALTTALWSKEVARTIRRNVEAAFLCGLLHSIGRPVIIQAIAEHSSQRLSDKELAVLWGKFETVVGMTVVENWKLPQIVSEAIGFYQRVDQAPVSPEIAAIVNLSTVLADYSLSEDDNTEAITNSPSLEHLNLYPGQVDDLIEKNYDVISSSKEFSK